MMPLLGPKSLADHIHEGFYAAEDALIQSRIEDSKASLQKQIAVHPGFISSILSTIRHYPLSNLHQEFEALSSLRTKGSILVLWGEEDTVTPYENHKLLLNLLGNTAILESLPNAGHVDALHLPQLFTRALNSIEKFLHL